MRTLIPATPLQDFDANSRSPVGNETEPLRCGTRDVDDDTAFANRRRGTAIDDAQIDGATVLKIRHADDRTERIRRMRRNQRVIVED